MRVRASARRRVAVSVSMVLLLAVGFSIGSVAGRHRVGQWDAEAAGWVAESHGKRMGLHHLTGVLHAVAALDERTGEWSSSEGPDGIVVSRGGVDLFVPRPSGPEGGVRPRMSVRITEDGPQIAFDDSGTLCSDLMFAALSRPIGGRFEIASDWNEAGKQVRWIRMHAESDRRSLFEACREAKLEDPIPFRIRLAPRDVGPSR